jgi:hypothetical protein
MANRSRGEITARLDGRDYTLCLTLGALGELESAFGVANLSELFAALSRGSLCAGELNAVIAAGLRGGGNDITDSEVSAMRCEGGLAGIAAIVGELFVAAFGESEKAAAPNPTRPQRR